MLYGMNNYTLAPSPSGRALTLTHMLALPKVDFSRAGSRYLLSIERPSASKWRRRGDCPRRESHLWPRSDPCPAAVGALLEGHSTSKPPGSRPTADAAPASLRPRSLRAAAEPRRGHGVSGCFARPPPRSAAVWVAGRCRGRAEGRRGR